MLESMRFKHGVGGFVLGFIWDNVAPLLFLWSMIGCMLAHRHWTQVLRVCQFLRTIPPQIETVWKTPPQTHNPQENNFSIHSQPTQACLIKPTFTHLKTIPETGMALLNPPTLNATFDYLQSIEPQARYLLPYGWYIPSNQGQMPDAAYADLGADTYNVAIISPEGYGKTAWVLSGMMALMLQRTPRELQFVIFNTKDADINLMENSAYTLLFAQSIQGILDSIKQLHAEAKRRAEVLAAHHVLTWNTYHGDDLPLIVVYIADPTAISSAIGKKLVEKALTLLMMYGPALGFRIIIESRNMSDLAPCYHHFFSDRLLGPMDKDPIFQQNGKRMPIRTIFNNSAIAPTQLPNEYPGVFTAVDAHGRAVTLRTVYISPEAQKDWMISQSKDLQTLTTTQEPHGSSIPQPI